MRANDVRVGQFLKTNERGLRQGIDKNFLFCVLKIYSIHHDRGSVTAKYWDSREGGKIVERGTFTPKFYEPVS